MQKNLFAPLWIVGALLLFLYSYTQVDLSLSLSRLPIFQEILKNFQYIGWFNRPLSTYLYIGIFVSLFTLMLWTLRLVRAHKISRKTIWITVLAVTGILTFSYNAFSYDLFNYIFDAKIVTHYGQNPYMQKALDFPGDPMLSFMRWTHRLYPYGPVWLALTVPISFVASNIFIVTFLLFKIFMAACFVGTIYFIEKIARLVKHENSLLPLSFVAFNPLVVSESLVSAHNDIVMLFFAMVSIYLMLSKRTVFSFLVLLISIGIKFATAVLLPIYVYFWYRKGNVSMNVFFHFLVFSMIPMVVLVTFRTTFQPWYLLYILIFAAFIVQKKYIFIPSIIVSIFGLLNYVPYLYFGVYDDVVNNWMLLNNLMMLGFGTISFSVFVLLEFQKSRRAR